MRSLRPAPRSHLLLYCEKIRINFLLGCLVPPFAQLAKPVPPPFVFLVIAYSVFVVPSQRKPHIPPTPENPTPTRICCLDGRECCSGWYLRGCPRVDGKRCAITPNTIPPNPPPCHPPNQTTLLDTLMPVSRMHGPPHQHGRFRRRCRPNSCLRHERIHHTPT